MKNETKLSAIFEKVYIFIVPSIVILALTTLFPFFYTVYLSIHKYDLRYIATKGVQFVGLNNFINILGDPTFWASLKTTVIYVGGALIVEVVLGILIAAFINTLPSYFNWLKSIVLIPMMLTPVVIATTFRLLYNYDFGLVGYFLELIGLDKVPWLATTSFARLALILSDVWHWTPLLALISLGALQAVPKAPLEAAEIDGASFWQKLRYIILPIIKPIIGVGILIRFMDIVKFFDKIYVLTGGGPGTATQTLTYYVYKTAFKFMKLGYGAAISIILLIGIIIVSNVIMKVTEAEVQL